MRDPKAMESTDFSYYVAKTGITSNYGQRTFPQLLHDVNVLHDFTRKLISEKDLMRRTLDATRRRLQVSSWMVWTLTIFVAAEGAAIGWLVKEFLDRFGR